QVLREHGDGMLARHERADPPPMLEACAWPQPALLDEGEQAGAHQGRFPRAAVAVDLEPAHGLTARARVEAGERIERLLLAPEEEMRLVHTKCIEADERATFDCE